MIRRKTTFHVVNRVAKSECDIVSQVSELKLQTQSSNKANGRAQETKKHTMSSYGKPETYGNTVILGIGS